jgi:hypothetical protein
MYVLVFAIQRSMMHHTERGSAREKQEEGAHANNFVDRNQDLDPAYNR